MDTFYSRIDGRKQLNCPICRATFIHPKLLPCCQDSFCESCIRKYAYMNGHSQKGELPCPTCGQVSPIPEEGVSGFADNKRLASLLEIIASKIFKAPEPQVIEQRVSRFDDRNKNAAEKSRSDGDGNKIVENRSRCRTTVTEMALNKADVEILSAREWAILKETEIKTGAALHFKELCDEDEMFGDNGAGILVIKGTFDSASRAMQIIQQTLDDSSKPNTSMLVPRTAFGKIYGRNGAKIKLIAHKSGAKIEIDKSKPGEMIEVVLKGNHQQVTLAKDLIQQTVNGVNVFAINVKNDQEPASTYQRDGYRPKQSSQFQGPDYRPQHNNHGQVHNFRPQHNNQGQGQKFRPQHNNQGQGHNFRPQHNNRGQGKNFRPQHNNQGQKATNRYNFRSNKPVARNMSEGDPEPIPGLMSIKTQRRSRRNSSINEAGNNMESDDSDVRRETVLEVTVPQKAIGTVIGKKGVQIKQICADTGAKLRFKDTLHKPEKDNETDGMKMSILAIHGRDDAVDRALEVIQKLIRPFTILFSLSDREMVIKRECVVELNIPKKIISTVTGRKWSNIRQKTGARLHFPVIGRGLAVRRVIIRGTSEATSEAEGIIRNLMEDVYTEQMFISVHMLKTMFGDLNSDKRAIRLQSYDNARITVSTEGDDRDPDTMKLITISGREADTKTLKELLTDVVGSFEESDGKLAKVLQETGSLPETAPTRHDHLNGSVVDGCTMYAGRAQTKTERQAELRDYYERLRVERQYRYPGSNVYVKNLDYDIDDERLRKEFSQFGTITFAKVMLADDGKSKGFGFVSFENAEAAQNAVDHLHGSVVGGRTMFASRAQKKTERQAELKDTHERLRVERLYQRVNVYVKNLHYTIDDERLHKEFSQFGTITSAKVMTDGVRSKGFGFVCFSSPEEATKAVTEMNNHIIVDKPLYVVLAQRKEDRKAHLASQYMQRMQQMRHAGAPIFQPSQGRYFVPQMPQQGIFPTQIPQVRCTSWQTAQALRPPMHQAAAMTADANIQAAEPEVIEHEIELFECGCCFDNEVEFEEMGQCNDGHLFCRMCITRYCEEIKGQGRSTFPCLGADCEENFPPFQLQMVLHSPLREGILKIIQAEEIRQANIPDLVTCPHCPYAVIMPDASDTVLECENVDCLQQTCRLCKEPNHLPLRCNRDEKPGETNMRIFIENKMTEGLLRTCHSCGKKFYKVEGCNHMTCPCGASMCYVCRQPLSPTGNHFAASGCLQYSDVAPLHEREVREAGEGAKRSYVTEHPEASELNLIFDPLAPTTTANSTTRLQASSVYRRLLGME